MASNPLRRRRLVDEVIDHLRAEIVGGSLSKGSKLPPESKLTAQLGVSRTTLREAIVALAHEGLVDVRHGDGTYVREPPPAWSELTSRPIEQLLELRLPLQLELTRLASSRRTEAEARDLMDLASQLVEALKAPMPTAAHELATAVESGVATAAHSPLLQELALAVSAAIQAANPAPPALDAWLTPLRELAESARGVASRDPESADRHARLWLASQTSLLLPDRPPVTYGDREIRRGPRARHATRVDDQGAN